MVGPSGLAARTMSGIKRGLCLCALGGALAVAIGNVPGLRAQQPDTATELRQCLQGAQARLQEGIGLLSRPIPSVGTALPKLYETTSAISDCMARFLPAPQ